MKILCTICQQRSVALLLQTDRQNGVMLPKLPWEIPIVAFLIYLIKKLQKTTTMKLFYLLLDQIMQCGQISDRLFLRRC